MLRIIDSINPYLVVFIASACGLSMEIVAARILAPTIGVSIYTWTSIIGVVLAGISLGNYLGGRLADRVPSPTTLGLILLSGGLSSLWVIPLINLVSDSFYSVPLIARIVLLTSVLFLVPSLILGMVTPVVIKLRLQDLAQTGNAVGKYYAVSTCGSIVGTFMTGFFLIQWLGTRHILLMIALILLAMALVFGSLWRARMPGLALTVLFVAVGLTALFSGSLETVCIRESNYYCIKVREREVDGRDVRILTLDKLLHSYVDLDDPLYLVYSYEKIFADLATYVGQREPEMKALFIGGGGYTMPRYLEVQYPSSRLEVIEIDPEVTQVAMDYFGLTADSKIITYNQDARVKVPQLTSRRYDLVLGDALNDVPVPYHLTTFEFNEQIKGLLEDDGIYAVNIVDKMYSGRFLRAYVNTLGRTFPHVYILRDDSEWNSDNRYPYVVVGSLGPLTSRDLIAGNVRSGRGQTVTQMMPHGIFDSWIQSKHNIFLTDDYVPVDILLGPLYLESR